MSKIRITASDAVIAGKQFTFKAPCNPDSVDSLLINGETYSICDALGNSLCKKSNAWKKDALVSVILDTDSKKAFILNSPKALGTTPDDIGAAKKTHSHNLNSDDTTGVLPIPKGGTGASTIPGAREALGIKSGSYTGTGSNRTFDTGMKDAKIIFIYGTASSNDGNSFSGFLTSQGGVFTTEEILKAGLTGQDMLGIRAFGRHSSGNNGYSGYIAYFESGVITLNTDHYTLNENGKTYYYTCF